MKRQIEELLIHWKNDKFRQPLLIKGIRQCGKTWMLKEFGKNHYTNTIYLNFEGNKPLMDIFERDLNVGRIINEIEGIQGKQITEDTLLIFDEIQFCPAALTSLKYFSEEKPEIHIACAGSLLGVHLSYMGTSLSYPVGKIREVTMYPLNFAEFLMANGEELLISRIQKLNPGEQIPKAYTEKLKDYYRDYLITGGMPAAVSRWIANRNIEEIEDTLRIILDNYQVDFAKHAPIGDQAKILQIWNSIPVQLAKDNQKFIFSQVKTGARAKDLEDALQWLIKAGLIYKITKGERPDMPLSQYADDSYFKIYVADVGLLRRMSSIPASALFSLEPQNAFMRGMLTENFVLTEFMSMKDMHPYFWRSKRGAEVEFLIQTGRTIFPVEVKAGENTRSKSLSEYRKTYSPKIAVRTSLVNLGEKTDEFGTQYSIPLYLLWNIQNYLVNQ
ncbi:ATP-binding protein [Methanocorpusculum sp.]|nr:ATP-binding protein [Methanocorpusculum sp.]